MERGLSACVAALKMTGLSFEKVFEAITSTETYTAVTQEQILTYYNQ